MRLTAALGAMGIILAASVAVPTDLAASTRDYAVPGPAKMPLMAWPRQDRMPRRFGRPALPAFPPAWPAARQYGLRSPGAGWWPAPVVAPRYAGSAPWPGSNWPAYHGAIPYPYGPVTAARPLPPRAAGYMTPGPRFPVAPVHPPRYQPQRMAWTPPAAMPAAVRMAALDPRFRPVRAQVAQRFHAPVWRPVSRPVPPRYAAPRIAMPVMPPSWAGYPPYGGNPYLAGRAAALQPFGPSAPSRVMAHLDPRFRPWQAPVSPAVASGHVRQQSARGGLPGWLSTEKFGAAWQDCGPCAGG